MHGSRVWLSCLAGLFLGWSGLSLASEPASFVLTTKDLGFPVIDTAITFTRAAEHTYRVRYSNPPAGAEYLMLYSGFYLCAVQKLALDNGFDRFALLADPDSVQSDSAQAGITVFLKPGEEASKVLESRFASATFGSVELVAKNCPARSGPSKQ